MPSLPLSLSCVSYRVGLRMPHLDGRAAAILMRAAAHQAPAHVSVIDDRRADVPAKLSHARLCDSVLHRCGSDVWADVAAVSTRTETLTYRSLGAAVERTAKRVEEALVACSNRRVALCIPRTAFLPVVELACWLHDCTVIIIPQSLPVSRVQDVLQEAKPSLVLSVSPATRTAETPEVDVHSLSVDTLEERLVLRVMDDSRPPVLDECTPHDARHVLYFAHTSGSTARPKVVAVYADAVTNVLAELVATLRVGEEGAAAAAAAAANPQTFLAASPESFDISVLERYLPLLSGWTCCLHVPALGHTVFDDVRRFAPDVLQATPSGWEVLALSGWDARRDAPHIRLVGGDRVPAALAQRLLTSEAAAAKVVHLYGPTEATIWVSYLVLQAGFEGGDMGVPLGRVVQGNALLLRGDLLRGDEGTGEGEGELGVAGVNVAQGYVAEGLVSQTFDGVFWTGDVVRTVASRPQVTLDDVYFAGRKDTQVKVRGNRVELAHIEHAAATAAGVVQAICAVSGDGYTSRLVLFVRFAEGQPTAVARLFTNLQERLPAYMLPAVVVDLTCDCDKDGRSPVPQCIVHPMELQPDYIPLTPNGKVDRKGLLAAYNESLVARDAPGLSRCGDKLSAADLVGRVCGVLSAIVGFDVAEDWSIHPNLDSIAIIVASHALEKEVRRAVPSAGFQWSGIEEGVPLLLSSETPRVLAMRLLSSVPELARASKGVASKKPTRKAAAEKAQAKKPPPLHPLIAACKAGDCAAVAGLCSHTDVDLEVTDRFGSTPVHYAAGGGFLDIVKLLVAKGARHGSDAADKKSGRTSLHWAARQGRTEVCRYLVTELAHPLEVKAKDDTTPLQLAAWGGHIETCKWLMSQGADIMFINKWGCTAVHFAALAGHVAATQWLHDLGLDLSHANYQGHNALHKAAYGGHRALTTWLLTGPPDLPLTQDVRGQFPHTLAKKAGYEELAEYLHARSLAAPVASSEACSDTILRV